MAKRTRKARIVYKVNRYCVRSHDKLNKASVAFAKLLKKLEIEGETKYLRAEIGKAAAKCKKYGIKVEVPKFAL
jgi:hypothetical protein